MVLKAPSRRGRSARARAYETGSEPGARSSVRDRRAVDPFDLVKSRKATALISGPEWVPGVEVLTPQNCIDGVTTVGFDVRPDHINP